MERPSRLAPLPPSSEALAPVGGERGDAVEAERLREEVQALRIRTLYQKGLAREQHRREGALQGRGRRGRPDRRPRPRGS